MEYGLNKIYIIQRQMLKWCTHEDNRLVFVIVLLLCGYNTSKVGHRGVKHLWDSLLSSYIYFNVVINFALDIFLKV